MTLTEMLVALKIELQSSTAHSDAELTRAVTKTVSLMSRLVPLTAMIETTIVRKVTDETLTISSNTGTLAYKPIKPGSLVITGKVLDTDYSVNYATGGVTEIGALLPDTTYTANYELDTQMLDLSTFLTDYVKIVRMEYPIGASPISNPTFDVVGDFLVLRAGTQTFTANEHARIFYHKRWTAPATSTAGDYPTHLDAAVIIGSAGQALIFKAEKQTLAALTALEAGKAVLDGITGVTVVSAPSISTEISAAETALTAAAARFAAGATALSGMDTPLANSATALGKVAAEVVIGKGFLTTGAAFINAATRGNRVGEVYGQYGQVQSDAVGQGYTREGAQWTALALGHEADAGRESVSYYFQASKWAYDSST